jgi:hypothetical protein
MSNPFDVIQVKLSAPLVAAGTLVVNYPTGRTRGDYTSGTNHAVAGNLGVFTAPEHFTVAFGAASATLTWAAATLPAGTELYVQLDRAGTSNAQANYISDLSLLDQDNEQRVAIAPTVLLTLGSPAAVDVDSVCTLEDLAAAGPIPIDGVFAINGVATLDVPRNLTVTSAADVSGFTVTATGYDCFGQLMVEAIAGPNAATTQGKKAFASVIAVSVAGAGNPGAISVGTGKILGLPIFLPSAARVLREIQDGAVPSAGTFVAGSTAKPTATTGDVRGTWAPNGTPDGSISFELLVAAANPGYRGATQFAG